MCTHNLVNLINLVGITVVELKIINKNLPVVLLLFVHVFDDGVQIGVDLLKVAQILLARLPVRAGLVRDERYHLLADSLCDHLKIAPVLLNIRYITLRYVKQKCTNSQISTKNI